MSSLEGFEDLLDEPQQEVEIVEESEEQATPETEPEVTEEPKVETTATEEKPWTLSAVLDEREKRQAAVKRAEELEAKLKAYESKTEPDVSIFEDEKGFVDKLKRETDVALRNTALNMSEAFAKKEFGADKVAAAKAWMISEGIKSPYALEQFNAAELPYHAAVKLYEDDMVRRDPEAYKAKLREEILADLKKEKPKPSTPSLASKRSVGDAHRGPEGFEDLLKD